MALRYEVRPPVWVCHRVRSAAIDVDWGRVYGAEWVGMRSAEPLRVVLATGSEISVVGAAGL
jgi:hypothetical protein